MARRSTQRIRTSEAGATFIEITWNHYPVFQEVYSLWTSEHMFDQVPGPKTKVFVTPCWCIIGAETKCSNNNIYGWFLILYPPVFVLKYLRLFIPSYILKPWKLTFKTLAEYHWTQIYVQRQCLCKRKIRIWKNTWLLLLGSWPDLTWMCSPGILWIITSVYTVQLGIAHMSVDEPILVKNGSLPPTLRFFNIGSQSSTFFGQTHIQYNG
jgi:hypothetical protein